ncbi:MAG: arsenate reductase ArsC [Ignavibacteriae bacterium]|nr:arsenate reductase ArsC [Ignavibacteriota bacterium]
MKKRVLIICTGNSCRSQMAEGFLRHISNGAVEVFSAGTIPSTVHPMAIHAMGEVGIDISHHTSKSVDQFVQQNFDYVITVCDTAKESCPFFPGAHRTLHIPFEDPVWFTGTKEERLEKFRQVRDQIKVKMKEFFRKELKKV